MCLERGWSAQQAVLLRETARVVAQERVVFCCCAAEGNRKKDSRRSHSYQALCDRFDWHTISAKQMVPNAPTILESDKFPPIRSFFSPILIPNGQLVFESENDDDLALWRVASRRRCLFRNGIEQTEQTTCTCME